MAYNLGALVTEVRTKAKDPGFDANLIKNYIQDTIDEVLGHSRFIFSEQSTSVVLTAASTDYTFDSTIQAVSNVKLTPASTPTQAYHPQYLPYRQFTDTYPNRLTATAGRPLYYSFYGRKILWPAPLSENITARFLYITPSPTLTNDTDVPVIPVEFKQLLVRGALANIEEYRENYDQAAIHKRKMEDITEDLLQRYGARQFISTAKATTNRRIFDEI